MEETPTTAEVTPETGAAALPVENVAETADAKTNIEPSVTSEGGEKPVPIDEKLQSFAKGQGIDDLSDLSDREKALLKSAYDSKADRDRLSSKTSELEKSVTTQTNEAIDQMAETTGQDPELVKAVRQLQIQNAVRDFWVNNPEAREYEPQMIEIIKEKPHLAGDLESLYATALVKSGGLDAVKSQGKREALTNLAQKQQATAPTGNATTSGTTPKERPFKELSIQEMEARLGFASR